MTSSVKSERLEEELDQKVVDWLSMNDLDRLSNFLESVGARNMNDIKFISKHENLMNELKINVKIIDYYKFINAVALLIDGVTKQCTPTTVPIEKDEVLIDVKMAKKRDATSAFTDTDSAVVRANDSSPSEFSAEDDDNIAKKSFLPHLYPPFVAYNDNYQDRSSSSSSSSSSHSVPEDINEFVQMDVALNSFATDNHSQDESSCRSKIKFESIPVNTTTTITATNTNTNTNTSTSNDVTTASIANTIEMNSSITGSNTTTTTGTTNGTQDNDDFEREREAFLRQFPLDRSCHVFNTKGEMEAALEGLTWDTIYHNYGWGYTAQTSGVADLIMIRDDCKKVKRKILKKYGVENTHYFNYINGGGHKSEYEKDVVAYFKRSCIFLNP